MNREQALNLIIATPKNELLRDLLALVAEEKITELLTKHQLIASPENYRPIHRDIDVVMRGYCIAMLWAEHENDQYLHDLGYQVNDIHPDTITKIREIVTEFIKILDEKKIDHSGWSDSSFGHDMYLTQARHGAGFWDRGIITGKQITDELQTKYHALSVYIGDDAKIHAQGT